jgi:ADP-ribosyl-[dinitrogen reductase] hydrolase
LLGLAVGDALGAPREGCARDVEPPLAGMIGGGPFALPPGAWTDDTALALCLADSLLTDPALDSADLLTRFRRWWERGENSATGVGLGIGRTTFAALERFRATGALIAEDSPAPASNGGIMRLAPVAIRFHAAPERAAAIARAQSRTTHAATAAVDAADLLARILVAAIAGAGKAALSAHGASLADPAIAALAAGGWRGKGRDEIIADGSARATLEAALWCVGMAGDFPEAVLLAANLGGDADTAAAIAGQIAGAIWGAAAIPQTWLENLAKVAHITERALRLYEAAGAPVF